MFADEGADTEPTGDDGPFEGAPPVGGGADEPAIADVVPNGDVTAEPLTFDTETVLAVTPEGLRYGSQIGGFARIGE